MSNINPQDLQELAGLAGPGGSMPLTTQPQPQQMEQEEEEEEFTLPGRSARGSIVPDTPTVLPMSMAARDELRAVLRRYQLDGLFDALDQAILADETLVRNADALFGAVRNNPVYQARFKGNMEREKKGLPVLSEAEYIQQEQQYLNVLRNLGMPRGFYDSQDSFANFIANDVSPSELSARVQQGYNVITNSPPQVLAELKRMVPDLTEGELAAYVLDPQRSTIEIERRARAAQIAAQATTAANMTLSLEEAEGLARAGVTEDVARQAFGQAGEQRELLGTTLLGEQALTREDILGGVTGVNQAAAQRIETRRRRRRAEFEQGGQIALNEA